MFETVLRVFVPVALMVLMFGMGLQLVGSDWLRLARFPKAVVAGLLAQTILFPGIVYLLIHFLSLPVAIAAGLVILAACPGGVASNAVSFLARADVPLSVTLTALSSVLALASVPIIVGLGLDLILLSSPDVARADAVVLPLGDTLRQILLVMLLPLSAGMFVRKRAEQLALKSDRWFRILNVVVLLALLMGAFAVGFDFLLEYFNVLFPLLLALNLLSMLAGYLLAWTFGLAMNQRLTIVIETGFQNVGVGLLIALNLLNQPEWIIAPSVYSIVMMSTAFALIGGLKLHRRTALGNT